MRFAHRTLGQRVVLDPGRAADRVAEALGRLAPRAVLLVGTERQAAVLAGLDGLPWTEVTQHVPVELAERARAAAADRGVDVVVAAGGGSAIGLAKAIALTNPVRIVAVPTTYAGSEATNVWGLTDAGGKTTGVDDRVLPDTVVYDPDLVAGLPAELARASALNAVAHCVDSFWAPAADPVNAALATEGLRALAAGIPAHDPARLQYGCYLAAVAFASAGSGLHHKICHVLGGRFALPHAQTHAIVLPYVLAFNGPAAPGAVARVEAALGGRSLDALRAGVPRGLRDIGLAEADLPAAVEAVLPAVPPSNPRPVDADALRDLLRAAWAGDDPGELG